PGAATVAGGARGPDAVHRPGQSVGERLLRELQRQAARRMLKRRALLFPEGGADRDRTMAAALQQGPAALRVGLPAASPGGLSPRTAPRTQFHTPWPCARLSLRLVQNLDQVSGAGLVTSCLVLGPTSYCLEQVLIGLSRPLLKTRLWLVDSGNEMGLLYGYNWSSSAKLARISNAR